MSQAAVNPADRAAAIAARNAAARSRLTRRDPDATPRETTKANQASLDARRALEHARQRAQDARRAHWNGTGTHHAMTTANQAAIDARAAWETARDQLVDAALAA